MAITTIDFDIADNEPITHTVSSRREWSDSWTDRSGVLFARSIRWRTNPEMPTAVLHYRYGEVDIAAGSFTSYATTPPVSRGDYIKIDLVGHTIVAGDASSKNKTWIGQVVKVTDDDQGAVSIQCEGLESILLEHEINKSTFFDDHFANSADYTAETLNQVLTFNKNNFKNRSTAKVNSHYGFSAYEIFDHVDGADHWSTKDVVEYILKTQTPVDDSDAVKVPFELDDSGGLLPDWDSPELNPDGQKTKDFLDSVITRSRALLYWLEVTEVGGGTDIVKMKIGTYASQEKDLPVDPPGTKLKQNPNRYVFNIANLFEGSILTTINNETRFDRIRCVGARAVYCFSLSGPDLNLVEKWKSTLKAEYQLAASTDGGYPAILEVQGRERADKAFRSHYKYRNVFSRLGVKLDDPDDAKFWNLKVRDGVGTGTEVFAVPEPDSSPVESQKIFPSSFRFLPTLPLRRNFEYEGSGTPATVTEQEDEFGEIYLEPIAFFKRPDEPTKWIDGSRISELANLETPNDFIAAEEASPQFDFNILLEMDPNETAFRVKVIGDVQHVIAPKPAVPPSVRQPVHCLESC